MSAIIGIRSANVVHLLTDGVSIATADGAVAAIHQKQAVTRNRVVVAGIGLWKPPGPRFAQLIDERCKNFDEAVLAARELWCEARASLSAWAMAIPFITLLAGWSEARECLELHLLTSPTVNGVPDATDPTAVVGPVDLYGGGPEANESGRSFLASFSKRFRSDPGSFDPCRDGVEFMKFMRHHCPRQYGQAWRPVVGGHVLHLAVTRDSIVPEIIHKWPADKVGHPIEIDHKAVLSDELQALVRRSVNDPAKMVDEPRSRLTIADLQKVNEAIVGQMTKEDLAKLGIRPN